MVKKRILSTLTALALSFAAVPVFTTTVPNQQASLTAVAAGDYNVPDVKIDSMGIPDIDSFKFVSDMTLGFNLGNTFDATDDDGYNKNDLDIESYWCGIKTSKEMIDAVAAAGFKTLRLPVSWHNHLDSDGKINKAWLDRVEEVANYAFANDMYVILNIHHDNDVKYMYPDSAHAESSTAYVTNIWTQLSERFKDYDEKLIFECLNEPRLVGDTYEWWLNMSDPKCIDAVETLNDLNQTIVNTIRKSGGNNAERYIMVPGYCASIDGATTSYFKMPEDTAKNKLILSVHAYTPYNFALQAQSESGSTDEFTIGSAGSKEIDNLMDTLYAKYISKNVPVVIGEFGARKKGDNLQARTDYATYYIAAARARGITCCWWDNNAFTSGEAFGVLDRETCTWKFPSIVEGLNKYSGNEGTIIVPPTDLGEEKTEVEGEILPTGKITFPQAIGDTVQLTVDVKDGANYVNGCLGFSSTIGEVDYWISYQWEASEDGDVVVNMKKPTFVQDTTNTDAEGNPTAVTDEAVTAQLIEAVMASTETELQYWYAADSAWVELKPASDYGEITKAALLKAPEKTEAEILPNGTINFGQPIGKTVYVTIETEDEVNFANGCICFNTKYDGIDYWVAYSWEAAESGSTFKIDMTKPSTVGDVTNPDADGNAVPIDDQEIIDAIAQELMTRDSAQLQYWYAADSAWNELKPASDYVKVTSITITSSSDIQTPTEPTTEPVTPPVTSENYKAGDANCDGSADIADVVLVKCYLINPKAYAITDDGAKNADVIGNDGLNVQDAIAIQKYSLKMIDTLPVA
ncbi:MAG: glycoside hydrolase family 5 [Ruminococcus sp.]|nr:glycoside hydrolase family 5 [Ruminococcus sp.]